MTHFSQILSPKEVQEFRQQGYDDNTIQEAVNESIQEESLLEQSNRAAEQTIKNDPRSMASNSLVAAGFNENLIQWQLELDSILERIEHMLRGDQPTFKGGSIVWLPAKHDSERILNKFGVAEVMRILSNYVNRNTILSNYREETINDKMFDLGNELADLFFLKYEAMGLDTLEKRKLYPILVRELVDVCHSSYLRALHGGERESLREARQVTQMDHLQPGMNVNFGMPQKQQSVMNPFSWFRKK